MTLKELKQVTNCHIFIERSNKSGVSWRVEWTEEDGDGDWKIENIKIVHANTEGYIGFALCVELEKGA